MCHHCHHPSVCPGWFWRWPEGSPMPPSVAQAGRGEKREQGATQQFPLSFTKKVPTWKLTSLTSWDTETSPSLVHMPGAG